MKIIRPKMWNLKYRAVPKKFEGELKYIADFDCGNYHPYAVWFNKNPNREKSHKDFMILYFRDGQLYVAGRDREHIQEYLIRDALHCLVCDEVIYSTFRHDCRSCSCGDNFIDGGSEYTRTGYKDLSKVRLGKLNLETRKFKVNK